MLKDRLKTGTWSRLRRHATLVISFALAATTFALAPTQPASAATLPAYVQSSGATSNAAVASLSTTLSASTAPGNAIIALVAFDDRVTSVFSCSDNQDDKFSNTAVAENPTNHEVLGVCYATNIPGGAATITATFGAAPYYSRIIAAEYSEVATSNAVDTTATNWDTKGTTTQNGVTSLPSTTAVNGDLIVGGVADAVASTSITAGAGFTQRASLNNKDIALQDMVQKTAGSVASTQTFARAGAYEATMVAFKPAGTISQTTPEYVQSNASTANTAVPSLTTTLGAPTAASNAIVALITLDDQASSTFACSDSQHNTYAYTAIVHNTTNHQILGFCYATNITGGAPTVVTVTFGAPSTYSRIVAVEYSGIVATNPVDVTSTNWSSTGNTTQNAVTSGAATTTVNGDLIVGGVDDPVGCSAIVAGPGFTQRASLNGKDFALQDKVQNLAGSIASTQTFASRHAYEANMVAFKAAP